MEIAELVKLRNTDYILRLTAEECSELIQASLKYIRSLEKMTPKTEVECRKNLIEEISDVLLCIHLLKEKAEISEKSVKDIYNKKLQRLESRWTTGIYKEGF